MKTSLALIGLPLVVAACGAGQPKPLLPQDVTSPSSYYPMAEGNAWSYEVDSGLEVPSLVITKVVYASGARFDVSSGGAPLVYELRPEGIYKPASQGWLLRAPLVRGASWSSGTQRTATVVETDLEITTPAGRFDHCIEVREKGSEDQQQVDTVYCAGVGPVRVRSRRMLGGSLTVLEARLRGYAVGD